MTFVNRKLHKGVSDGCLLVASAAGINSCRGSTMSLLLSSLTAVEMRA